MQMGPMEHSYRIPLPIGSEEHFSEFNHHLAGLMLLMIGISCILILARPSRFGFLKYVWPLSFVIFGAYLIVYSDPDSWPTSFRSLSTSLIDPEVRQHKVYALLLLAMGVVETLRSAGIARRRIWGYVFPSLAVFGALLLIVHRHGGMSGEGMPMDEGSMRIILYQHISYIIVGIGIATTRLLADTGRLRGRFSPYIWPSLTVLLGLLLIAYRE